jgi:hypothetical protein
MEVHEEIVNNEASNRKKALIIIEEWMKILDVESEQNAFEEEQK